MTVQPLRKYQRKGVRKLEHFDGYALLADEMGLGKTRQFLAYVVKRELFPAIVICPASVKWHWQDEAASVFGLSSIVCDGRSIDWDKDPTEYELVIINYDIAADWIPWLRSARAKVVGLDECHYISNPSAKRSRAVRKIVYKPKKSKRRRVVGMSGTPLTNRPAELWHVLNLIRPDKFPHFRPYAKRFCKPTRTPWGWQYKGAARLDELHRLLNRTLMIRRLKRDVLKELPAVTHEMVPLDIADRKQYEAAERDVIAWLKTISMSKAKKAAGAERLVRYAVLKQLAAELKMKALIQWMKDFMDETDEKLLMFAHHKSVIRKLRDAFPRTHVVVDGSVTGAHRKQEIRRFVNDKSIRHFFGNIKAVGTGTDGLQHATGYAGFAELPWNPADIAQCIGRVDRIGQTRPVNVFYLVGKGTIEDDLCKINQRKQRILDQTLDGKDVADFDLFNELEKAIRSRK